MKKYDIPEGRAERLSRLAEAVVTLKTEFVGLETILDEIANAITPWYITPEVLNRPTVISLWGMTGTGKTSVVRRLMELLGLSGNTITFDCGLESADSGTLSIADKINDVLGVSDETEGRKTRLGEDLVFVLDEFQYARSIGEDGCEQVKPSLRPIWSLMDSGIVSLAEPRYDVTNFCNFVDDFTEMAANNPEIAVEEGTVSNPGNVKTILEAMGLFFYDRGMPGVSNPQRYYYKDNADENEDPFRELRIIDDSVMRTLVKKMNTSQSGRGYEIIKEIYKATKLHEISTILSEARKIVSAPLELNCSKSLIFILGNLDEAFKVEGDINPDYDADIFYDITSKVSVADIKNALKSRFRAEQIARFGNNIIKYPTLKREHFEKIIKIEVTRILSEFKEDSLIDITVEDSILDLLYAEGVFPVQGVRPVFTTIGTILTPILSKILINLPSDGTTKSVNLYIPDYDKERDRGFKISTATINIEWVGSGKDSTAHEIPLILGPLRDPARCKTRFINAVHEIGHAILYLYRHDKLPRNIVAVTANGGGFCDVYDPTATGEINSRYDVDSDVMVALAGYEAEKLIYSDTSKHLLGSSSDLDCAWSTLTDAAYSSGYYTGCCFASRDVESGHGVPSGLPDSQIISKLQDTIYLLTDEVARVLKKEELLLRAAALELGETGEMSGARFSEHITLHSNYRHEITGVCSDLDKYYESEIKKELGKFQVDFPF